MYIGTDSLIELRIPPGFYGPHTPHPAIAPPLTAHQMRQLDMVLSITNRDRTPALLQFGSGLESR